MGITAAVELPDAIAKALAGTMFQDVQPQITESTWRGGFSP